MSESVLVTVLMSVYNEEKYIEESINSILAQTYKNFEFIIIDDASTDQTVDLIKKYSDVRIRLIRNAENQGLTRNLNQGLKLAEGKYILRMDADDIALENRLEEQVAFMEKNQQVVLAGAWMQCFGKKYNAMKPLTDNEELKVALLFGTVIMHPTFIIRKSIIDENGIVYNEKLRYAQDYGFTEAISHYGELANIPQILLKYRIHDEQVTVYKRVEQRMCANVTRCKMLENLNIFFTDEEFEIWARFCMGESAGFDVGDIEKVEKLMQMITKNNSEQKLFDENLLKRAMESRKIYNYRSEPAQMVREKLILQIDVLNQWLKMKQEHKSIIDFFEKHNIKKIAIYGMGELGKRLYDELESTSIEVTYFLDRNEGAFYKQLERKNVDDKVDDVDAIIVTVLHCFNEIEEQLYVADGVKVVSLQDVIYSL